MRIGIGRRLRRDKRGVSNVLVVVLSLVIIVTIVANVILWSYEMNQMDWEKIKEDFKITDVARVTESPWYVAQSEYTVNKGSLISGDCTDTQTEGSSYETFMEGSVPQQEKLHPNAEGGYEEWGKEYPTGLAHWDCCNEDPPDDDNSYVEATAPSWAKEVYNLENHTASGTINWVRIYIRARLAQSGTVNIRTLMRTHDTNYESGDIPLSTSYQDKYSQYTTNPYTGLSWTWDEIDSLQAGALGQNSGSVLTRMTAVWVVVNYSPLGSYELDVNGTVTIDVSTYPIANIQSVEIRLRYRANDTGEQWYLKAYSWTSNAYSNGGFNGTSGHTPTMGWDYYTVNLTDKWNSYVSDTGTIYVKFQDNEADGNRTTVDIDFLGVRAKVDGARFTFKNESSLTTHLVSLWIVNSTLHQHYDADIVLNSAETYNCIRANIQLPLGTYVVKVVSERGNTAVYSFGS